MSLPNVFTLLLDCQLQAEQSVLYAPSLPRSSVYRLAVRWQEEHGSWSQTDLGSNPSSGREILGSQDLFSLLASFLLHKKRSGSYVSKEVT